MSIAVGPPVPAGAVVAFDRKCPADGWETYQIAAGRFLLGSNRSRLLHEKGGEEKFLLSVEELRTHNHDNDGELLLVKVTGDHTASGFDTASGHMEFSLRQG